LIDPERGRDLPALPRGNQAPTKGKTMNAILAHIGSGMHGHPEDIVIIIVAAVLVAVWTLVQNVRRGKE
jgi:hypothetical protein